MDEVDSRSNSRLCKISGYFFITRSFFQSTLLGVLVCGVYLFASCGGDNAGRDASPTQRLVLATSTDPKTFNPVLAQETSSTQILNLVFEGLTSIDPHTGEVVPHLARSWSHDSEGRVWTFHLREDVRWSDGTPFRARDVVFTFNDLIYNPTILSGLASIFSIDGKPITVRQLDEHTVEFQLPSPFAPFLRALGVAILPAHVLEPAVHAQTFNETWGIDSEPAAIIGTGPFMIETYVPGERIILTKNTHYWKRDPAGNPLPRLAEIVFLHLASPDLALLKFKNGEIDMYGMRSVDYPWLRRLEEKEQRFRIYERGPSLSTTFVTFNKNTGVHPQTQQPYVDPIKQKWFRSLAFRRAVAHAIDVHTIIDLVHTGLAIAQRSAMSPSANFYFTDDVRVYEYSIEKARALLAAEGFIDRDGDDICEDPAGNPVRFNFFVPAGNPQTAEIANLIRKDLSRIGVHANVVQVEFNTLVNKLTFSYDWDMAMIGLSGGIEPHFGANVWVSSSPLHMWYPRQAEPQTQWEARIDEIFSRGVRELDPAKRKTLYDEWQRLVASNVPVIYTVIPLQFSAVANTVKNIKPAPLGGLLHNVEELFIAAEHTADVR